MESKPATEAMSEMDTKTPMETLVESFRRLTDEHLLEKVHVFVERERTATATVVASLVEVDSRQLYLARGHSSLHVFCMRELKMSEGAAYRRIAAARAVGRFPVALEYLVDGSLSLTTLTVLAPALTPSNHEALLEAARHKTRREVEQQVAALNPDLEDFVWIRLRIRRSMHDRLRRAQDLLRHTLPSGDVGEILDRALNMMIAGLEKKKMARVGRPHRARPIKMGSRYISAAVRRAVVERDGGQCAFVGTEGRCTETGFLEFHHVKPFARGGGKTIENIELRCRAHNQYESDVAFATETTKTARAATGRRRSSRPAAPEGRQAPTADRLGEASGTPSGGRPRDA